MILRPAPGETGTRLDVWLSARLEGMSRSAAQSLIEQGGVLYDPEGRARPARKNQRVEEGDVFAVTLPQPKESALLPQEIALDIVYEDADLIVLNKPKGLVVHPAPGHEDGTLVNALLAHCGDSLSGIGGERRPGIVHRLDKDTSGLMLCAKNDAAHRSLSAQLADRSLSREYEAIVHGHMPQREGSVNAPIGRHPVDRKRMAVTARNARPAETRWRVLADYSGYSYICCILRTGRTHQIRVHMQSLGHPVAGDWIYGGKKGELGLDSQCLHARRIRFLHPRTGELMQFSSDLPDYFTQALARLGEAQ